MSENTAPVNEEQLNAENQQEMNELFAQRLQKAEDLKAMGINPYGERFDNHEKIADCRAKFNPEAPEGEIQKAIVAGRLTAVRVMGKSIFADVKDSSGRIQLYIGKNSIGEEQFDLFKRMDIGDIIGVEGHLFTTKTGELSIKAENFKVLCKSLRPLPEKYHGLTNVEQRYRQRYLDLIVNDDSRKVFQQRIAIIREIRRFMEERGFMEVETPMLQAIAGGASANPFKTYYEALNAPMYMRIAPELYLKRLLVGGFEKVFELNRNFRNEGVSRRHNPEFTMMEVYQAYGDCNSMMELVEDLITTVAMKVIGTLRIDHGNGKVINLEKPWRRITYHDIVREKAGADWFELTKEEKVKRATEQFNLNVCMEMSELDITNEVYEKMCECNNIQPTFVTRLPAELLPLARTCKDDPTLVDVFELGINGQEIAPAYTELNDPVEQRKRFMEQFEATKAEDDKVEDKVDEDFLVALEHGMPPAGGMGIGIDRLIMLLTGSEAIRDVLLFPQMKIKK